MKKSGIVNIGFSVPKRDSVDVDTFTLACESSMQTVAGFDVTRIDACYFGSETRPYSVKSVAAMLATTLGLENLVYAADIEFACKSGTSAMQVVCSLIESSRINYGLAVASDCGKAEKDDPLADTVGSGSVSLLLSSDDYFCEIIDYVSIAEDVSDFWRTNDSMTPNHEGRFTGEGGYLKFVQNVYELIKTRNNFSENDIDHVVLHMPNKKFPFRILERLGFVADKIEYSFVFEKFGNCFSACSLLGLAGVLEKALPNKTILLMSYGSGAGADAFLMKTNESILQFQQKLKSKIW